MWLCLNNAFLSIVQPYSNSTQLLVRARREGDIETVFPTAKVKRTPGRDYLWRAEIDRNLVGQVVAQHVAGIDYPNFKDSVDDRPLHDAYARFWGIMANLQEIRPYSRDTGRGVRL